MENVTKDYCSKETSVQNLDKIPNVGSSAKMDESKSHSKKSDSIKEKPLPGLLFLKQSFRTLSVPKKSTDKDKNEPSRFLGEGVAFKAKLIGILEVEEARGDKMCQEALLELKMAVRAAGEHKQRINIVIAVDGIRLRDEKTGDCLHHHPVHKISFIAQDVADSRAFGYIFGSPDTSHRFFGIKTDKAASQVVMAMRDLFQAVYELKKREVDLAKQNIEHHQMKYGSSLFLDTIPPSTKNSSDLVLKSKPVIREDSNKNVKNKTQTAGVIADLVDLELELNSLQQGLSQMQRLTPSDPFGPSPSMPKEDPFGDSFTPPPCITSPPPAKLPPPPASGDRRKLGSTSSAASQPELHWFDKETQNLFNSDKNLTSTTEIAANKGKKEETKTSEPTAKDLYDIFTELDPLGTGRSKPYMDKKDFFQELKNPPKKQLKDLKSGDILDKKTSVNFTGNSKSMFLEENEKLYEENIHTFNSVDFDHRITLAEELAKSDPCNDASAPDPFETSFANFATFDSHNEDLQKRSPQIYRRSPASLRDSMSSDSFQITLKNANRYSTYKSLPRTINDDGHLSCVSSQTNESFLQKHSSKWSRTGEDNSRQKIIINLRKVLSSADDTDKENDSPVTEDATVLKNFDAVSPIQGDISSDSFESIPEPPPRPITSPMITQPPPLPPKKLQLPVTMKPPTRSSSDISSRYDYIENYESLGSCQRLNGDIQIPPLPAPARKPKFGQDVDRDIVRHRPQKQSAVSECEYYLTPISKSRPGRDDRSQKIKPSLNITISQLTSTDFEDLAAMLRIPASTLSKMTLKELTECLSRLSDAECQKLESDMSSKNRVDDTLKYCSLRESFDDDSSSTTATFKANFDEKFPVKPAVQVDKYAVFRELIEQEEKNQYSDSKVSTEDQVDNVSEPVNIKIEEIIEQKENDKYAALRIISNCEKSLKESSEKEDSGTEVMLQTEDLEQTSESVTLCLETEEAKNKDDLITASVDLEENTTDNQPNIDVEISDKINDGENDKDDVVCENELSKNWAKFDSEQDAKERKTPPWEEENKDSDYKYQKEVKRDEGITNPVRYRKQRLRKRWNDNDEEEDDGNDEDYGDDSEENWESSKKSLGSSWDESSWRENGWSDRDSLYDDAEGSPAISFREQKFNLKKKGYHRKFVSHKKSPDISPWEEDGNWQIRKSKYKDFAKDNDRIYEERKVRTPPWTSERKRYESREEDELMLLKMMLGEKRLKALEDKLFKHYHDQLSEPLKKSYYYAKNSSKDSPCEEDYSDVSTKPRYIKKHYMPRPKSADKGKKPLQLHSEDTKELFSNKKYRRPYSHDELSISEEEKWSHKSPTYKKPTSRNRNQSQTSPFEDNFAPQSYEFTDSPSEAVHLKSKTLRYPSVGKKTDSKRSLELHPYSTYDFKSARNSRESSQRQSPFEDDFTSDIQRSGDARKEGSERRNDDDVFYSGSVSESLNRNSKNNPRSSRLTRYDYQKRMEKPCKYYENVDLRKSKISDSYYEKIAKDKYKYSSKDDSIESGNEIKSPKKVEGRKHDPFNDNVSSFDPKTMPRLQKAKSKSKIQNYDSESDTPVPSTKWKDDLSSFTFSDQPGRK